VFLKWFPSDGRNPYAGLFQVFTYSVVFAELSPAYQVFSESSPGDTTFL
jgi:hypothetical protein